MFPAGNKAKRLSSVNHITKTIHHHNHHSTVFLFRLMKSNRTLIILIMDVIHIFQYYLIFNKMTFSNISLRNTALLIVVIAFVNVKIGKFFRCNILSSDKFLKITFLKIYLYHQICKLLNFYGFI